MQQLKTSLRELNKKTREGVDADFSLIILSLNACT